jgi:hypothetical protein
VRPSELNSLAICPGYIANDVKGEAAEEGIKLHHAVEVNDLTGLVEEQIELVKFCQKKRDELIDRAIQEDHTTVVFHEHKLKLLEGLGSGIYDMIIISPQKDRVIIVDYKFGHKPVLAPNENLQGYAYVLGALNNFPEKVVMMQFIHARNKTVDSEVFYKYKDDDRLFDAILNVVKAAQGKDIAFNPNRSICSICKNCADCPAVKAIVLKVAETLLPKDLNLADNLDLATPANRAFCQKLVPILELYCDRISKSNLDMVQKGMDLPGYTLVKRQGRAMVSDIPELFHYLRKHDIPTEDILPLMSGIAVSKLAKKISKDLYCDLEMRGMIAKSQPAFYLQASTK